MMSDLTHAGVFVGASLALLLYIVTRFVGMSAITDSGWAIAAGAAGQWIKSHPRFARGQRFVTGGALIGLGATAALTGSSKK